MASLQSNPPTGPTNPNWSDLPRDILHRIIYFLDFTTDIPRLRAICPSWRSHLPLSLVRKLIPLSAFNNFTSFKVPPFNESPLLLLQSRFYLFSPSDPTSSHPPPLHGKWLARVVPTPNPQSFSLCNPLNFQNYILPCTPLVGKFNLLDCRVIELARPMCLVGGPTGVGRDGDKPQPISKKVVGGFDLGKEYKFAVMAQLGQYDEEGGLIVWRLYDKKWTQIPDTFDRSENGLRILDVAFYDGKFYTFSLTKFQVGVIDPDDKKLSMGFVDGPVFRGEDVDGVVTFVDDGVNYILGNVHFVGSNGRLYFVVECRKLKSKSKSKKGMVMVFVMRQERGEDGKCEWDRVRSLNEVFFIGFDVSFSLPMANENLTEWKAGSICFFTRPFPIIFDGVWNVNRPGGKMPEGLECLKMINYAEYWRYLRLYVMEGEEAKNGIVPFEKLSKELYTGLFFPPPAWVKWTCPSKENAVVKLDRLKFRDVRGTMKDMGTGDGDASSDEEEKENDGA